MFRAHSAFINMTDNPTQVLNRGHLALIANYNTTNTRTTGHHSQQTADDTKRNKSATRDNHACMNTLFLLSLSHSPILRSLSVTLSWQDWQKFGWLSITYYCYTYCVDKWLSIT